jgi:transcriptional antiterminator RfaH
MTAWFCLKAQTKREHIAADHVRQIPGASVFLPRIRLKRKTVRGPAWFTEALFPGYLFARFEFTTQFRQVQSANGVRGIVHFGDRWPAVPDDAIYELQRAFPDGSITTVENPLTEGEQVEVAAGAFRGLKAVICRVMPARERVLILLDFLGRQTTAEVPEADLIREGDPRHSPAR